MTRCVSMRQYLSTGQTACFDSAGHALSCAGTGQDGEVRAGKQWPDPRFVRREGVVRDLLTGLVWSRDANPNGFPLDWMEAFAEVRRMNREKFCGFSDWRLPNRRELRSLMSYQAKKPALPSDHPFVNVFLGWYWTSTTAAIHPAYAWYVHLEGARMFYGAKKQECLLWPVRGESCLAATGQLRCYDVRGRVIPCRGTGQDGELRKGVAWPEPRFSVQGDLVVDRLTCLAWSGRADIAGRPLDWQEAFAVVDRLNEQRFCDISTWRLPNINELESLVDSSCHSPALPAGHPFAGLQGEYWSSTTSFFETDWAWVLYLEKGACGVGYKPGRTFHVWPVCDAVCQERFPG